MEPTLIDSIASTVVQTISYYLPKYNTDSVVHESLWALRVAFQAYGEVAQRRWADECGNLVDKVLNDEYLKRFGEDVDYDSDAVNALREARQIKELFEPLRCSKHAPEVAG